MQKVRNFKEDVWIPTSCAMCFNNCGILAHRVDGVVVKLEGNPNSPVGNGRICGKGAAGIMQLYDNDRLKKPMKRTNSKKGRDIDPGWQEISWEEAYDILLEKYKDATAKGPNNFMTYCTVANLAGSIALSMFHASQFGVTQGLGPDICGAGVHTLADLFTGTGNAMPDYIYCKYIVQFGTQAGTATRHGFNMTAKKFAEARTKGCKLISIDPHMSAGAEKADLWVPIRPGTDGALALGLAYVLVHELGIYDEEFLKTYTNGPLLVDPQTNRGLVDKETGKQLYWDEDENRPKPHDDPNLQPALEGCFSVDGVDYKTGFTLYKEHIKKFTPKKVEEITTVPAAQTRQVARELGEAACIGQTITIDGKVLPYRPVCVDAFSGVSRHKHSFLSHWSVMFLNVLLGSATSVGGSIGYGPRCKGFTSEGTPNWEPTVDPKTGLLNFVALLIPSVESYHDRIAEGITPPTDMSMKSIMPFSLDSHMMYLAQMNPALYKTQQAEFLFVYASNPLKNWGNHDQMEDFLRTFKFIVGCDIYLNDSSYYYDLILPEACYLERYEVVPTFFYNHHTIGGLDSPWAVTIRQPVSEPPEGLKSIFEIFADLAERLGGSDRYNGAYNYAFQVKQEYNLPCGKKVSLPDFVDSIYKSWTGPEHDLEWYKKNGVYTYPRKAEEVYILQELGGRLPVYFDFMLEAKEKIETVVNELDIYWETSDYQPLPDWKPCVGYPVPMAGYDLLPVYYTNSVNVDSWMLQNAWINEINESEPFAYGIEINSETAVQKGLVSGDRVRLTSPEGYTVEGCAVTSEGVHPEVLAVIGGHWGNKSDYMRNAKGKGVPINNLIEAFTPERMDHVVAAFDQCVRVKIEKIL